MLKKLLALCTTLICAIPFPLLACSDAATLATLQNLESVKFLENAPTFKHAWEDKAIQLEFVNPIANNQPTAQDCVATLQLTLPQQDLDEVNTYLDENPAKRILL